MPFKLQAPPNMDQRMFNAASSGDVQILHQLLEENPFILSDYTLLNSNHENPLTISIKANQQLFAREILKLNPKLAIELNQDGLRPLDVAAAYGTVEIAREILASTWDTAYRLPGRDGRTAIHYAAMNGRVEIIDELLFKCSDFVMDVTSFGETALHLAVKYFKFEALRSLLQWIGKLEMVEVVNWEDKEGNTVLHYVATRKQLQSIQALLEWNKTSGNKLQLNAVNKKGLTPLDIIDIITESSIDIQFRDELRRSGGYAASEFQVVSERPEPYTRAENNHFPSQKPKKWQDIVKHFEFQWQRDSPGQARETLLLVAALIATVTFEAGINPPSYLFERSNITITRQFANGTTLSDPNNSNSTRTLLNQMQSSSGDLSIMVSITVFLVANSVALSTSTSIIDYLMAGFPFQRELRVSMFGMIFAYAWSMGSTRPTGVVKNVLLGVALCTPLFLRILPYLVKKIWKCKE